MSNPSGRLEVNINEPGNTDLVLLADSTTAAFELLLPLCTEPAESSTAIKSLVVQAQSYVKAIDYSIVAAQIGFNIAEEAINFFKVVESRTSEADLTSYLAGMWNMALNGHHNAQLALDEFKGVRTTIETRIREAKKEQKLARLDKIGVHSDIDLSLLETNLIVLEEFANSVSNYISWWNFIEMSEEAQSARIEQLTFKYSSLREKSVIKKWEEMRRAYVTYKEKITLLQTKYGEYKWLSQGPNNAKGGEKTKRGELIGSRTTGKCPGHATGGSDAAKKRMGEKAGNQKPGDERRDQLKAMKSGETTEGSQMRVRRGGAQETVKLIEKTGGDGAKGIEERLERNQAGCLSSCIVM